MSRTGRVLAALALVALLAGAVLMIIGGETATIVGGGLLGVAGVLALAIFFLLVGEAEDRDRREHPQG